MAKDFMDTQKRKYFTIPQAAQLLGITRIAVYKRVKKGTIKAIRVGRTYAITARHISVITRQIKDGKKG